MWTDTAFCTYVSKLFRLLLLIYIVLSAACSEEVEDMEDNLPDIKVTILNGCGFRGAASDFSDFLSRFNVDIVGIGNADSFNYDKTIIVVKRQDEQDLERLMRYTNITRRAFALSNDTIESFQIIVGRDYLSYIRD